MTNFKKWGLIILSLVGCCFAYGLIQTTVKYFGLGFGGLEAIIVLAPLLYLFRFLSGKISKKYPSSNGLDGKSPTPQAESIATFENSEIQSTSGAITTEPSVAADEDPVVKVPKNEPLTTNSPVFAADVPKSSKQLNLFKVLITISLVCNIVLAGFVVNIYSNINNLEEQLHSTKKVLSGLNDRVSDLYMRFSAKIQDDIGAEVAEARGLDAEKEYEKFQNSIK